MRASRAFADVARDGWGGVVSRRAREIGSSTGATRAEVVIEG